MNTSKSFPVRFGTGSPLAKPLAKALRYAAHTVLGAAMSWVYFAIFAIAVPVAGALSIVWLGLPLLLALVLITRGFAGFERYLAVKLLDADIAKPSMPRVIGGKMWSRLRWNIAHSSTWRGIVFLVLRMLHGMVASMVLLVMGMLSLAFIVGPLVDSELQVMKFTLHGFAQTWILMPLGLVLLVITILIAYGWASFMPPIARLLLGPSTAEDVQKLRIEKADLAARNDLARELHDSVGHAMTTVVVQASAARDAFERDGGFAKQALADIESAARDALSDLDSVLGALREGAPITDDNTLAEIAQLVASTRRMGANVNMNLAGDLEHLPANISNVAYRVVKEGITNALKHGELKTNQIDVGVQVDDKAVRVEVKNYGIGQETKAQRSNTFGWGLRGLTARVTELGGSIESGQSANGGYLLRVSLPSPTSNPSLLERRDSGLPIMSKAQLRIAIVDDDPRVISGMQMLINGQADMCCVAQAADGAAAVRMAREITCDVILMDVRMPGMDGIAATREIVKHRQGELSRVLVMTTFEHDHYVYDALAAGASGFVLKRSTAATVFEAIRVAAQGEALVLPVMTRNVVQRFSPEHARVNDPRLKLLETLTEREVEMLRQIALGLTNAEIAEAMAVSINTVKTHVANVLGKLALRDRTQAVILAYETGFIQRPLSSSS